MVHDGTNDNWITTEPVKSPLNRLYLLYIVCKTDVANLGECSIYREFKENEGVMAKVQDWRCEESEFEFQSLLDKYTWQRFELASPTVVV